MSTDRDTFYNGETGMTEYENTANVVFIDNGDIEPELWVFENLDDAATFAQARGANPEFIQSLPIIGRTDAAKLIEQERSDG